MKKRIMSIIICMLLISTLVPIMGMASENHEMIKENTSVNAGGGYILDQMQTIDGYYYSVLGGYWRAQSFKPSLSPLVKVRLHVESDGLIEDALDVSIRAELSGEDLTYVSVPSANIPAVQTWIDFDFPDITVEPEETYYIVVRTASEEFQYHWLLSVNADEDRYERGSAWISEDSGDNWEDCDSFDPYSDFCFKTYSYGGNIPDLECNGVFGWPDQKPGSTVNDSFTVENVGDPNSLLNWEIAECPEWGEWTFTPSEGYDLTPEDGKITVQISVVVPDEKDKDFTGEIKIVNKDDEDDSCTIQVTLSTPVVKQKVIDDYFSQCMQKIFCRFPLLRHYFDKLF